MSGRVPRVRMFAGPNGSGKSSLNSIVKSEWLGVYINADDIERKLRSSEGIDLKSYKVTLSDEGFLAAYEKLCGKRSDDLNLSDVGCVSGIVRVDSHKLNSYHAAMIAELIRYHLLEKKVSFSFETVMSHESKVEFLQDAADLGYRTYLYFIATEDPQINVERVAARVRKGGHGVPLEKIVSRYTRAIKLLPRALRIVNRGYVFDNSGAEHLWVVETQNAMASESLELEIKTGDVPAWLEKVLQAE